MRKLHAVFSEEEITKIDEKADKMNLPGREEFIRFAVRQYINYNHEGDR